MPVDHLEIFETETSEIPHIIKYMGSKRNILGYILPAINDIYKEGKVYDLFAGTAVLAGALKDEVPVVSNDIQEYSSILSNLYLSSYNWNEYNGVLPDIIEDARTYRDEIRNTFSGFDISYDDIDDIDQFRLIENKQRQLIDEDFSKYSYHLFTKYYSGTYWSFRQCLWIDSLKRSIDNYKGESIYYVLMSSLMFAMAYNSQSTGHYAQYRDTKDRKSMEDILIYRNKQILPYFKRKFRELKKWLGPNSLDHEVYTSDYRKCLENIPERSLVYADPPYCFVHYSRFYHALETLVKYDYPEIKYKGRYRDERHQSPFCIRTKVKSAFAELFNLVKSNKGQLILSYSNSGMIDLNDLIGLAEETFKSNYEIETRSLDYEHSTMGRRDDKSRDVKEALVIAKN